jgi:hypothetical protein
VKLGQNVVDSLTDEQAWIADFWDDNPFKLNVSGLLCLVQRNFHTRSLDGYSWYRRLKSGTDFNEA